MTGHMLGAAGAVEAIACGAGAAHRRPAADDRLPRSRTPNATSIISPTKRAEAEVGFALSVVAGLRRPQRRAGLQEALKGGLLWIFKKSKRSSACLNASALGAMDVSEGDFSLSLKRACDPPPAPGAVPMPGAAPAPAPIPAAAPAPAESGRVVKSPLAGVFYAASSPDAAPFVQAGDRVKKGDTLCIIEAMKVMNELTADADGEVEAVLAENGQIVEYGQPLFRLKD